MAIEPVTREERFLAAAGGRSVTPPTPITRKEQLLQGIIDAVKSGGATPDVIENAVNNYLDANPVKPGATTEQAAQIEQNKSDIADLQTEVDELKESGGNGSGQNVDLTGYAEKQWVQNNYQPKGDYALRSELPTVPTKVSAFTNDAGYLTKHQDISGKVDKDKLTLGRDANGLLYLYIDGVPAGAGIELPTGGIDGYVDADKNIVVRGLDEGVTYKFFFELADGSLVEGGELVYDNTVYYTVTNTLTNCTTNNSATQVAEGESYSATITAKSGYTLSSVTVTMGGSPASVSGGKINIASITGNIVITAVAEEIKAADPVTEAITITGKTSIVTDTGATRDNTAGYCSTPHIDVSDIPKPCVIELTNAGWSYTDATKSGYTRFYIADTTGAKIASGYTHPSKMPDGVTMECGTETTNSDAMYTTATVTVTSDNIGTLRFAGYYSTITPDGFDATVTKATLTYTPAS